MANPQIYAGFMSNGDPAYEIQRTNNFRIDINLTEFGGEIGQIGLACETAGLPNQSTDPLEAPYGNSVVKFAGRVSYDDVSITCRDYIEKDIEGILMNWRNAVYDSRTGKIGWAKNYKREARVTLYSPNGTRERTWILHGVWPTSIELGDLDYTGADLRKITMTLSVDSAEPDRSNYAMGAGEYGTTGDYTGTWNYT